MILKEVTANYEYLSLGELARPLMRSASIYTQNRAKATSSHSYPVFEVHYVHTGNLTWELDDGSRLNIRGGDVSIIQPNTKHHSLRDTDTPCIFLALCIPVEPRSPSPPFSTRKDQETAFRILRSAGTRVTRGWPGLGALFIALRNEVRKAAIPMGSDGLPALPRSGTAGPGPTEAETLVQTELVRGLLHQVFLRILQSLVSPVHAPRYAAVKRARRYIEQHVGERITVRDIARAAGLGTVRLHTLFRAETGETPAEYVLRQRLERSADLLRNSAVSIASIADRFGFSSSQNFARSFRKYFRTTPTACRRSAVAKR